WRHKLTVRPVWLQADCLLLTFPPVMAGGIFLCVATRARARGQIGDRCAVRGKRFESTSGPATLGTTAKADLLLRTWCNGCRRHVDVDPGEQAARYGADLPVRDW